MKRVRTSSLSIKNSLSLLTAIPFPGGGNGGDEPAERPVLPRALPGRRRASLFDLRSGFEPVQPGGGGEVNRKGGFGGKTQKALNGR